MQKINIVWLKRDLRTQDHEPLQYALTSSLPFLIIFIFEPSVIQHPDTSLRHLQFQYYSIVKINESIKPFGHETIIFYQEAEKVFDFLSQQYEIYQILSYQEIGLNHTFQRDIKLKKFFKNKGKFIH